MNLKAKRFLIVILILGGVILGVYFSQFKPSRQNEYKIEGLIQKAEKAVSLEEFDKAILYYQKIIYNYPDSEQAPKSYLAIAKIYKEQGKLLEAKNAYNRIIELYSGSQVIGVAQHKLWDLNVKIITSPIETPNSIIYEVKAGDTLAKIAKKFNTTIDLIRLSNNLESDIIHPGQRLKVSNVDFTIIVDISQNILTLVQADEVIKVYPVSTGVDGSTPIGTFEITNKLIEPVWHRPGAIVPSGSPENILGSRWMGISKPGYGIHGTIEPETIGEHITRGCVRMRNSDVEELFTLVTIGTKVTIMD